MNSKLIKVQKLERNDRVDFYILGDIEGPLRGLRIPITKDELSNTEDLERILDAIAQRAYNEGAIEELNNIKDKLNLE